MFATVLGGLLCLSLAVATIEPEQRILGAMTSVHNPPIIWNRTLPNPVTLASFTPAPSRRGSSLSQHHINSAKFLTPVAEDTERRNTLPSVAADRSTEEVVDVPMPSDASMSSEDGSESLSTSDNPNNFCLCQPERKIPRPRNAFILYRQHRHAAVVGQHPGLPNPEVSKIIGEQWKHLSTEEKDQWKALAEQEKARHAEQFPDYRYKPKRTPRAGADTSTSGTSACEKCGGKAMNPPGTPHPSVFTASMQRPLKRTFVDAHNQPIRTPSVVRIAHPQAVPMGFGYQQPRYESLPTRQVVMVEHGSDAKRQRLMQPSPRLPPTPYQPCFPRSSMAAPPPPPPSSQGPPHASTQSPYPQRPPMSTQGRKELTLAPIRTLNGQPPLHVSESAQSQSSGVEAMIMAMSVTSKLKTQASITPTLQAPGPGSPAYEIRGSVIAVEGLDRDKVTSMCYSLAEQLERNGKFAVRIFGGPDPFAALESSRCASIGTVGEHMTTSKYLHLISEWHKISKEMIQYITTRPSDEEDDSGDDEAKELTGPFQRSATVSTEVELVSPFTTHSSMKPPSPSPATATSPPHLSTAIPIALVPHYQLTTVDTCSVALPITDNYDPLTHWRWHATLWRGCVGPDITVVMDGQHEAFEAANMSRASIAEQHASTATQPQSQPTQKAISNAPAAPQSATTPVALRDPYTVEVRLTDHRAVIVKQAGPAAERWREEESWDKVKRRVGFEVEEFLRQ